MALNWFEHSITARKHSVFSFSLLVKQMLQLCQVVKVFSLFTHHICSIKLLSMKSLFVKIYFVFILFKNPVMVAGLIFYPHKHQRLCPYCQICFPMLMIPGTYLMRRVKQIGAYK